MRKVIFKEWIPVEHKEGKKVMGTACFSSEYTGSGLFHSFGFNYEEFNEGVGNYSIAIVELPSGKIVEVLPINLKFVEPNN